jgi:competence protein ComEA
MDPNATPWRALEDPVERGTGDPPTTPPTIPRSAVVVGGGAILLSLLAFLLAFGTGAHGAVVFDGGGQLGSPSAGVGDAIGLDPGAESDQPELIVEIVGAVDRPGVFRLPPGARVGDLVEAAGGYGARVDASRASRELNLAAPLHDGDQVRVPSRDDDAPTGQQPAPTGAPVGASSGGAGPLDLNRATSAELEALPGIGPVTAAKIVTSREEQPFAAVADLRARKLVGEKTYEKLKNLVTAR